MKNNEKELLKIALSQCSFLRGREKCTLYEKLDGFKDFLLCSLYDISRIAGRVVHPKHYNKEEIKERTEKTVKLMEVYDIKTVFCNGDTFPPLLREIPDAPFMLFYRGVLPDAETPAIAMVGTRHPTGEGIQAALSFGKGFAEAGIPVISGLAYGIDTYSHRGCLEADCAKKITAAVLACGVDRIYPATNKRLAVKILEAGGCILSEYPPGTEPLAFRFPERNRIISGLSRSVFIVEAPKKSGALITGNFALEQGRDVYVCQSLLSSPQNAGCAELAEQGAVAITGAADVFDDWNAGGKRNRNLFNR